MANYTATPIDAVNRAQMSANIIVANEPAETLKNINMNFDSKRAAKGQVIVVPVMPASSSSAFTARDVPGVGNANQAVNVQVLITNVSEQSNAYSGEQLLQLENTGIRDDLLAQFLAQAERTFRNEMEADVASKIIINASRAIGTPGTIPFATDLKTLIQARKILDDNGAPVIDRRVIVNTSAYSNILSTNLVSKAMEAGTDDERRRGVIKNQYGFDIAQSAGISDHASGNGTNYHTDAATYTPSSGMAAKNTAIVVKSGTLGSAPVGIQYGDIITFAADTKNKYCVNPPVTTTTALSAPSTTGSDLTSGAGTITIGNPGLRKTIADNNAISILSGTTENGTTGYAPSFAFSRHAVVGVIRPPMIDSSPLLTVHPIKDDVNGLTYLFGESIGVGCVSWWLWVAYGFKVTQSEYVVLIAG